MIFWVCGSKDGKESKNLGVIRQWHSGHMGLKMDESSDNNILGMQDQRGKEPKNGVVMRQQLSRHAEFKMERNTLKLVCQ